MKRPDQAPTVSGRRETRRDVSIGALALGEEPVMPQARTSPTRSFLRAQSREEVAALPTTDASHGASTTSLGWGWTDAPACPLRCQAKRTLAWVAACVRRDKRNLHGLKTSFPRVEGNA